MNRQISLLNEIPSLPSTIKSKKSYSQLHLASIKVTPNLYWENNKTLNFISWLKKEPYFNKSILLMFRKPTMTTYSTTDCTWNLQDVSRYLKWRRLKGSQKEDQPGNNVNVVEDSIQNIISVIIQYVRENAANPTSKGDKVVKISVQCGATLRMRIGHKRTMSKRREWREARRR